MIKKVDISNIDEMIEFAYRLNNNDSTSCKSSKEKHRIEKQFNKRITSENDFILAVYIEDELEGVFACLVETDDHYLECVGGYFNSEEALKEILVYLKNNYSKWHIDFVYPKENELVLNFLKKNNGQFDPLQIEMELHKNQLKTRFTDLCVTNYEERYFEGYQKIHDTDCYWIADKVVKARDIFDVYLAINNDEVVGYIDISKDNEIAHIFNIFVAEPYREIGYGRALMQRALDDKKKVTLSVNADNEMALRLYTNLGCVETGNSVTIGIDL